MANSTTLRHVGLRPATKAKAGAMAHRHSLASRSVAAIVLSVLLAFCFFLGMVQVSNQVNSLRSSIALLQDQQENIEAHGAALLAHWNKATQDEIIADRAQRELGLQLPESPAFVLLRSEESRHNSSWRNLFHGFSQSTANAAVVPGNNRMNSGSVVDSP